MAPLITHYSQREIRPPRMRFYATAQAEMIDEQRLLVTCTMRDDTGRRLTWMLEDERHTVAVTSDAATDASIAQIVADWQMRCRERLARRYARVLEE